MPRPRSSAPGMVLRSTLPLEVLDSLAGRLVSFCKEMHHPVEPALAEEFIELGPQLLQSARQSCSWYVLRSADGHALLIDLGYSSSAHSRPSALGYRTRFLPTHVEYAQKGLRNPHDRRGDHHPLSRRPRDWGAVSPAPLAGTGLVPGANRADFARAQALQHAMPVSNADCGRPYARGPRAVYVAGH